MTTDSTSVQPPSSMLGIGRFVATLFLQRAMIFGLTKHELRMRYAGTLAGILWSFVQPLLTILTYWLVFDWGLKVQPANNLPFTVVFVCGIVPWMTFAEAVNNSANAVTSHSHLVRKIAFPTEILPAVNVLTSLVPHLFLLLMLMILIAFFHLPFSFMFFQSLYFLAAMTVLAIGIGWFLGALNVFYRDLGQAVTPITGLWFWLTPIVWPIEMVPERIRPWLALNPMTYIVEGYRNSFLYARPFWADWIGTVAFWSFAIGMLLIGAFVFKRLKPEFADVL